MRFVVGLSIVLMACGSDDSIVVLASPPTVELVQPAGPLVEGQQVVIEAQVGDRTTAPGDLRLRWQAGGGVVCGDSVADSGGLAACTLTLDEDTQIRLTVTDADGETANDTLDLQVVANAAPSITIARPTDGASLTASGPIALEAQLADVDHAVTALTVEWTDNGEALAVSGANTGSDGQFTGVAQLSEGAHVLRARVSDPVGASQTSTVEVTVVDDDTPPSCTWLAPGEGSVLLGGGPIALSALVTDNISTSADLTVVVSSSADGVFASTIDAAGAVTASPSLSTGAHTLTLIATDATGLTCTATRAVEVCTTTWYADMDEDGFGDPSTGLLACAQPVDFVADNTDCDDTEGQRYPGADEICDLLDNDCDELIDDEDDDADAFGTTWYADADEDSFGDAATAEVFCVAPSNYVQNSSDCDDSRNTTFPGAAELDSTTACHADADDDGYGASDAVGSVAPGTDCDDAATAIHPGATEVCNGDDDDCNTLIDDDDDGLSATTYYADADSDGFGDPTGAEMWCSPPSTVVSDNTDCDDSEEEVYPGAPAICDGQRNDCSNGSWVNDDGLASFKPDDGPWQDWSDAMVGGAVSMDTDGTLALCPGEWTSSVDVTADVSVRSLPAGDIEPTLEQTVLAAPMTVAAGAALSLEELVHRAVPGPGGYSITCTEGEVSVARARATSSPGASFRWLNATDCTVTLADSELVDDAAERPVALVAVLALEGGALTTTRIVADVADDVQVVRGDGGVQVSMSETELSSMRSEVPLLQFSGGEVSVNGLLTQGSYSVLRVDSVASVTLTDVAVQTRGVAADDNVEYAAIDLDVQGTVSIDQVSISRLAGAVHYPPGLSVSGGSGTVEGLRVDPTVHTGLTLLNSGALAVSDVVLAGVKPVVQRLPSVQVIDPVGPLHVSELTVTDVSLRTPSSDGQRGIVEVTDEYSTIDKSVSFSEVAVSDCSAESRNSIVLVGGFGDAAHLDFSDFSVSQSTTSGPESVGAALRIAGSRSAMTCTRCTFENVSSSSPGGGVRVDRRHSGHRRTLTAGAGAMSIAESSFERVFAPGGASVSVVDASVDMDIHDSTFDYARMTDSEARGGHILWVGSGTLHVEDSSFSDATAYSGACIASGEPPSNPVGGWRSGGTINIVDSEFDGCRGTSGRASLDFGGGTVAVSGSSIANHSLGIRMHHPTDLTGSDVQFSTTQHMRAVANYYSFGPTEGFSCTASTCTVTP